MLSRWIVVSMSIAMETRACEVPYLASLRTRRREEVPILLQSPQIPGVFGMFTTWAWIGRSMSGYINYLEQLLEGLQ